MTTMNTILVVLDGSEEDGATVAHALKMASGLGAAIELFSCVYDEFVGAAPSLATSDFEHATRALIKQCTEELEQIAKPLGEEGHSVSTSVTWDKPAYKGVVRRVLGLNPRLVVCHRKFHSSIARSVFSNDDWSLIRTCPAPLLITRESPWQHETPRIWAAVDPVHEREKPAALDHAIIAAARSMSTALQGTLDVVHTYDTSYAIADAVMRTQGSKVLAKDDIGHAVRERHASALDALATDAGLAADQVHLRAGSARKTLPGIMVEHEADCLVLGAVARSRLQQVMLGHTAEYILDRLPCDVLIVKPDEFVSPVHARP